jgi:hypothetical protein
MTTISLTATNEPLDTWTKVKEVLLVFFALILIAAAQYCEERNRYYEERDAAVNYLTLEVALALKLDEVQIAKIKDVNYEYYDRIASVHTGTASDHQAREKETESLYNKRNIQMASFLNQEQKRLWITLCSKSSKQ